MNDTPRTREKWGYPTGMRALRELMDEGNHDIAFQFDVKGKYEYMERRKVDFEAMRSGRAIHLSHKATDTAQSEGPLRPGRHLSNNRAQAISDLWGIGEISAKKSKVRHEVVTAAMTYNDFISIVGF